MNIGGASDRPVPDNIWQIVQDKLASPETADDPVNYNAIPRRTNLSACNII